MHLLDVANMAGFNERSSTFKEALDVLLVSVSNNLVEQSTLTLRHLLSSAIGSRAAMNSAKEIKQLLPGAQAGAVGGADLAEAVKKAQQAQICWKAEKKARLEAEKKARVEEAEKARVEKKARLEAEKKARVEEAEKARVEEAEKARVEKKAMVEEDALERLASYVVECGGNRNCVKGWKARRRPSGIWCYHTETGKRIESCPAAARHLNLPTTTKRKRTGTSNSKRKKHSANREPKAGDKIYITWEDENTKYLCVGRGVGRR